MRFSIRDLILLLLYHCHLHLLCFHVMTQLINMRELNYPPSAAEWPVKRCSALIGIWGLHALLINVAPRACGYDELDFFLCLAKNIGFVALHLLTVVVAIINLALLCCCKPSKRFWVLWHHYRTPQTSQVGVYFWSFPLFSVADSLPAHLNKPFWKSNEGPECILNLWQWCSFSRKGDSGRKANLLCSF